jgi:hypothetical protein
MTKMLDIYDTALMVQAFACNARVAAMQAENQYRADCGNSVAYAEEAFLNEANRLDGISDELVRKARY